MAGIPQVTQYIELVWFWHLAHQRKRANYGMSRQSVKAVEGWATSYQALVIYPERGLVLPDREVRSHFSLVKPLSPSAATEPHNVPPTPDRSWC
jgi:hypothetical protein